MQYLQPKQTLHKNVLHRNFIQVLHFVSSASLKQNIDYEKNAVQTKSKSADLKILLGEDKTSVHKSFQNEKRHLLNFRKRSFCSGDIFI